MIANINSDELLDKAEESCFEFPLMPYHGAEINFKVAMDYLGVKQAVTSYLHAASYLCSKNSKSFLSECYDISQNHINESSFNDEVLMNCMLWKHNQKRYLNHYNPHYGAFDSYLDESYNNTQEISFHLFNGCKSENKAMSMLTELRK